ncbi:hypothetical protein [Leifsonia sp. NPDC080035]|uniref:Uncharacterized protein n=1 Tax=Leifsonia sp. NPDC080035 TaxID=3143936 RepID=A0AAU7G6P1_9MICO
MKLSLNHHGWIGAAAGLLSLIPGMQWLAPIALVASAASVIYMCITGGLDGIGACIVSAVMAVIPGAGRLIGKTMSRNAAEWITEAWKQASQALGISFDMLGVSKGWG